MLKWLRVVKVPTQTDRPRPSVNMAQKTTSQPCARSQPRFKGRKSAGRERINVTKMKMELTTPATTMLVFMSQRYISNCTVQQLAQDIDTVLYLFKIHREVPYLSTDTGRAVDFAQHWQWWDLRADPARI
jgi:hypothetical protein